jgi:acetyltransferase
MNPVDMLGGATQEEYAHALRTVKEKSDAAILLPVLVPQALVDPVAVAQAFIQETSGSDRTTITCMVGRQSIQQAKIVLHKNHIPMLDYPEDVGEVLEGMLRYKTYLDNPVETIHQFDADQKLKAHEVFNALPKKQQYGEAETRPLLAVYGVKNVEGKSAATLAEARQAAQVLGYPVVLKVISDEILHKSDAGGIRLDVKDERALAAAYESMLAQVKQNAPQATIQGVLVEKMQKQGEEVIVGMKRDANFGPLLLFGMGGIYVEAIKDVSFRIAPVGEESVRKMIAETAAGKILNGLRGIRYDVDAVIQTILALGQLSLDFPEVQEIEINPLKVFADGNGAYALDSRMIIK